VGENGSLGEVGGTITNCHSSGIVLGDGSVGGLVGGGGIITDCYSTATVSADYSAVGGLAGGAATVTNCYATGDVSGGWGIGGLIGGGNNITNCYATGNVSATVKQAGGLAGQINRGGTVTNCYATGSVSVVWEIVGGLTGENQGGTIINCYATGNVQGDTQVGGLVGYSQYEGTVTNCYSTGSVTGTTEVGGLMGRNESGEISASFWDIQTSGRTNMCGSQDAGGSGCDNGNGKTTAEMRTESTFTSAGWDFFGETDNGTEDIWTILEGIKYPEFTWQNPLELNLAIDNVWMYQNVLSGTNSRLTADVLITDDPWDNTGYSYHWQIVLPSDVSIEPVTISGGGNGDPSWTFAAPGCNEPGGISDSGQTFTIRVTITGANFGNTGIAQAQFGIALLGDVNNDTVVDVADRGITNAFWRYGSAGSFTLADCDVNCDDLIDVADRGITNAIWRGLLGQNIVSSPCPLR
jgi:hypothetical protein